MVGPLLPVVGLRRCWGCPCPNRGGMHPRRPAKDLGCLRLSRCSGGQRRDCKDSGRQHPSSEPHRHGPRLVRWLGWVGSDRCGGSGSVTRIQLRLLNFRVLVPPCSGAILYWGLSSDALGFGGCNDGRPASALYGWWTLQGSPRELLLPWGCCHAGAYVMRRSCLVLALGADRGHGMDGRHPGHPLAGPGAMPRRRLAGPGPIPSETVILPLKPVQRSGAEHPVVNQRPAVAVGPRR
jgi:hypothetical protein